VETAEINVNVEFSARAGEAAYHVESEHCDRLLTF
jgi:hypothetical protein